MIFAVIDRDAYTIRVEAREERSEEHERRRNLVMVNYGNVFVPY